MRKSFNEFFDFRLIFQPVPEVSYETGYVWGFHSVREMIVHPEAIFLVIDKARFFKYLQMFGNTGLCNPERLLDLADTHHLVLEHLNDFDSVLIRKGLHNLDEISQLTLLLNSVLGI